MHQRHNIRHSMHQSTIIRQSHIPSQISVSLTPHPQQMQQNPPQMTQQSQNQQPTQHATISIGSVPQMMQQYIQTRADPNRLGHHISVSSQQQQPPPQQITLQQPQLSQRISPQMHQTHFMKSRPSKINNNNQGGVSSLQQQHAQQQPLTLTTSNINNQQNPVQQPPQRQVQKIQPQKHNNLNNKIFNQKQNQHNNKGNNPQSLKYEHNTISGSRGIHLNHKINQLTNSSISHSPIISNNQQQVVLNSNVQPCQIQADCIIHQTQDLINPEISNQCTDSQSISHIVQHIPNNFHANDDKRTKTINSGSNNLISHLLNGSATVTQNNSIESTCINIQTKDNIESGTTITKLKLDKFVSANESTVPEQQSNVQITNLKQSSPESAITVQHCKKTDDNLVSSEVLDVPSTENISSGKEKTPMCLVNELARYNQIQHQYRLTGEQGPAHSKKFTVILKLGDEEYSAEGLSIKKAQHTAAAEAIMKTKYEHPPPKKIRHKNGSTRFGFGNITPTVELNALAMKLGEKAVYVFDSPNQHLLSSICQSQSLTSVNQTNLSSIPLNPNQQIIANSAHSSISPLSNVPVTLSTLQSIPNYYCETNYQYGQFNSRNNLVNIYLNGNEMRFPNFGRRTFIHATNTKYRGRMINSFNGFHSGYARDACKITLLVGKEKFSGIGPTVQAAKHDAASKALEILKPLAESSENDENDKNCTDTESETKSPISLVYEIGLKRNMIVTFEVKSEVGPPHLKNFMTICKVGDITTEGEGNGKKVSKKRAAKKMLEELCKLPPLSPDKTSSVNTYQNNNNNNNNNNNSNNKCIAKGNRPSKRNIAPNLLQTNAQKVRSIKKRTKNFINDKIEPENSGDENPISRLIHIQQALKEREPMYTVVDEKGAPRRREFTIEVSANGQSAKGSGSNKKLAKKNAAKNLLIVMGYNKTKNDVEALSKENNINHSKTNESSTTISNKPIQQIQSGVSSRQIVPGLIKLPPNKKLEHLIISSMSVSDQPKNLDEIELETISDKKQEINNESIEKTIEEPERKSTDFGVRPKDQLLYLAQILGFEAEFTDYPKGNHGEYLTIVALFTDPPQLCHGAGENSAASQDSAALAALQMLSKLGLDNVKPKKNSKNSCNSSTDQKFTNTKKNDMKD